jgi:hypothetical protein
MLTTHHLHHPDSLPQINQQTIQTNRFPVLKASSTTPSNNDNPKLFMMRFVKYGYRTKKQVCIHWKRIR